MTTSNSNRSPSIWLAATVGLFALAAASAAYCQSAEPARGDESPDSLLREALAPRDDLPQLTFRPRNCRHFDRIQAALAPSDAALKMFDRQGVVVLRQKFDSNFGEAYYDIYRRDLPVLITSDSILHVFHRSFDNTLMEMEENALRPAIRRMLNACHAELARRAERGLADESNYRDVDLYLTVAINLIERGSGKRTPPEFQQGKEVERILTAIDSQRLQNPLHGEFTKIYGGHRPIDYSQFQPRGHYTKSQPLQAYFQAMMWLGRADCGFFPLGVDKRSGLQVDADREMRDAVLLTDLLIATKQMQSLDAVDRTVAALWGESDNLRPVRLRKILDEAKLTRLADLQDKAHEATLRAALVQSPSADQKIQSQVYFGGEHPGETISPPALFQMFGQRFAVDSYVLANVVYDTVPLDAPNFGKRTMPRAVDVMAALGSPEALHELAGDLQRWKYAPQLLAARQFTDRHFANPAGQHSIADQWLAALRTLHADRKNVKNFPQAMQTHAWRLKQLNAQLASWAELRHDGILFIKQPYTRHVECDYPNGFVEPYPEFYKQLGLIGRNMARNVADLQALDVNFDKDGRARKHWTAFAGTMDTLERLARQELKAEPFEEADQRFLKSVVTINEVKKDDGCGGHDLIRAYTGWYCDLYYGRASDIDQFVPTVADVHTDSNTNSVLEVGAGRADLAIVAIDNGNDRTAYVGPVATYYEFRRRASDRMTDEEFKLQLISGTEPERPAWIKALYPAGK
jgi:hypothetical protein